MTLCAGIDVGSGYTKAVLLDGDRRVCGLGLTYSGTDFGAAAEEAHAAALAQAGASPDEVGAVVTTGYGRSNVAFATASRTEIDCHARGAYHHFPRAITVVDIGGQDNKVIQLDQQGKRLSFAMNRKCAAGTGSFLEEISLQLRIPMDEFPQLAAQATDHAVKIGSYCTVFAKTEILAKIRAGTATADLARAALESVARRVLETKAIVGEVVATGGVVAHFPLLREILAQVLRVPVHVPPDAQHIGALGAALSAHALSSAD